MNVWLVKLEESVPMDQNYRPYRMGMLETALAARGHRVLRWCSDLNHLTGLPRHGFSTSSEFTEALRYEFISSGLSYKSPISLSRIIDNFLVKIKLQRRAKRLQAPDLILCSMPTPAMCKVSAKLAAHFSVPLVMDCRDYWPEIIHAEAKGWRLMAAHALAFKMRRDLRYACRRAHSFVGITEFFTNHLVNYSQRPAGPFERVFPLGFSPAAISALDGEGESLKSYWAERGVEVGPDKKIFYFAGRLNTTVYNAVDPVVEAVRLLETAVPESLFVFCGSGSQEAAIRHAFVDCQNVILPGEIDARALAYLRAHSVAALQPIERRIDYQNSYSNKFFEYLSSGLPVFSWLDGVSGQKLVSEQCGFIYNNGQQLADQVTAFCEDGSLRSKMSARARALFDKEFDSCIVYDAFAQHLEAVYADGRASK